MKGEAHSAISLPPTLRKEREGWGTHLCGKVKIPKNLECATRHRLELPLEDAVRSLPRQQSLSAITTESQKMKTAALLVTDKFCHDEDIL